MGSVGKVAFAVILGLGALTGIIVFNLFTAATPKAGIVESIYRKPIEAVAQNQTSTNSGMPATTGAGNNATQNNTGAASVKITIPKDAQLPTSTQFYDPKDAQVKPGSSVVWVNQDTAIHTATSGDSKKAVADNIFDTGIISPGQSSKPVIMPSKEGDIPYFCQVHPFMVGTIKVK
jgi:plastocyanin